MSQSQSQSSTTTRRASLVGLFVAWGGIAMLAGPVGRQLGDRAAVTTQLLSQLALWVLLLAVLAIMRFGERESFDSLWLPRFTWRSFAWAAVLVPVYVLVLFPLTEAVRGVLGLTGYTGGMTDALAMPLWIRIVAVLTAGIVEEILFRGYTVTRLLRIYRNVVPTTVIASLVFAIIHLPMWGTGPTFSFFLSALAMNAFFLWRRDLWTMIIAHIGIDAWGLIVAPQLSEWWRN